MISKFFTRIYKLRILELYDKHIVLVLHQDLWWHKMSLTSSRINNITAASETAVLRYQQGPSKTYNPIATPLAIPLTTWTYVYSLTVTCSL